MFVEIETRIVSAQPEALIKFSREALGRYAESLGVERGRNKADTVANLMKSGKATLCASLGK